MLFLVPAGTWLAVVPLTGGSLRFAETTYAVSPGQSRWLAPMGLATLVLGCLAPLGGIALLRRWAPRWLGPTAGDRLVLERDRARKLARTNQIARDLHDSIGHALTAIGVQAQAALAVGPSNPALVEDALRAISDRAHGSVAELDRVLGMLGEDDRPPARLTQAGDLTRLVADLPPGRVAWRLTGDPAGLAGAVGEAAYRITQEAVTNALRHGTGVVDARVDIGDRVAIEVVNDIAPQPIWAGTGRGVTGMRERAALVGGRVSAGPEGGRWIVRGDPPAGEPS